MFVQRTFLKVLIVQIITRRFWYKCLDFYYKMNQKYDEWAKCTLHYHYRCVLTSCSCLITKLCLLDICGSLLIQAVLLSSVEIRRRLSDTRLGITQGAACGVTGAVCATVCFIKPGVTEKPAPHHRSACHLFRQRLEHTGLKWSAVTGHLFFFLRLSPVSKQGLV